MAYFFFNFQDIPLLWAPSAKLLIKLQIPLDMFLQSLSRLRGSSPRWLESWASFAHHLRGMKLMTVFFVYYYPLVMSK
jgi:hypothetical protein